jgi:hypothetical protein
MDAPRRGTNPKYINQKWFSYGHVVIDAVPASTEEKERRKRGSSEEA